MNSGCGYSTNTSVFVFLFSRRMSRQRTHLDIRSLPVWPCGAVICLFLFMCLICIFVLPRVELHISVSLLRYKCFGVGGVQTCAVSSFFHSLLYRSCFYLFSFLSFCLYFLLQRWLCIILLIYYIPDKLIRIRVVHFVALYCHPTSLGKSLFNQYLQAFIRFRFINSFRWSVFPSFFL